MHPLVCTLIVCVFLLDFLRVQFGLPKPMVLVPELLSGIALLMVLNGVIKDGIKLRVGFLLLFVIFVLTVVGGLFVADATAGPLVGGLRFYGKYVPFLLLPLTVNFSEAQIRQQMMLLLAMAMLQFPVTFLQRFILYAGHSGDMARGTFSSGSQNAIVMLSTIACVVAMYHKKLIPGLIAGAVCLLLFLPSTMAEVKGAFVLLPLVLLVPTLFLPKKERSSGQFVKMAVVVVLGLVTFSAVYQIAESTRDGRRGDAHRTSIMEFLTDPQKIVKYLAPQLDGESSTDRVGRIDGVIEPLREFKDDPLKLATGLGLGALVQSPFSYFSADQHAHIVEAGRAQVTMSYLLWEIGLLGTALVIIGLVMVWRDALFVRQRPGLAGALALGWLAVVPVFFLAMFWKNTLINNAVMYLFAYWSGHVLAIAYDARSKGAAIPAALVRGGNGRDPEQPGEVNDEAPMLPPLLNEVARN